MKTFLALWFLFSISICDAQISETALTAVDDMIKKKMTEDGIPGLSVAIAVDGTLAWSKGYGYADLEHKVKTIPATAYRSASIGKPITATAIMQLVEAGKLDLDEEIQTYCSVFPKKRWPITTKHLLSHTSGIRHYGVPENLEELNSKVHYENIIDPLDIFKDDSLLFKPGYGRQYSTYAYNLLGCVLEGAAKMEFMTYLQARLFTVANMPNTRVDNPYLIIPNRSSGYALSEQGELQHSEYVNMSNKVPAGGFITTVEDLANFASAFMSEKLVSRKYMELMMTPHKAEDGEIMGNGLGWALIPDEKWYGEREAFHGGGTPGLSGILYLLPDKNFAIAILMNLEGVDERVDLAAQIAVKVLDLDK